MLEALVFGIEHRYCRPAARPDASGRIDPDRMRGGAPSVRQWRVLIFRHPPGARIKTADPAHRKLGGWQLKRCLLAGFRIEAHHSVAPSVIGNPQLTLLVLDRAPRAHAVASR